MRFGPCLDLLLANHTWRFSTIRQQLAETATDEVPPVRYPKTFTLPGNLARLLRVMDANDCALPYDLAGDKLYSITAPINIRYVRNYSAIDPGVSFPDQFAETLACYLAADICPSLTQKDELVPSLLDRYTRLLAEARFSNAIEMDAQVVEASSWIDSRSSDLIDIDPRLRT